MPGSAAGTPSPLSSLPSAGTSLQSVNSPLLVQGLPLSGQVRGWGNSQEAGSTWLTIPTGPSRGYSVCQSWRSRDSPGEGMREVHPGCYSHTGDEGPGLCWPACLSREPQRESEAETMRAGRGSFSKPINTLSYGLPLEIVLILPLCRETRQTSEFQGEKRSSGSILLPQ